MSLPTFLSPYGEEGTYAGLLGDLSLDISDAIGSVRRGDVATAYPEWDPFGDLGIEGLGLTELGIDPTTMTFTGLTDETFELPFYEPYEVDPELKKYDPEKLLPWEEEAGKNIPGGQR